MIIVGFVWAVRFGMIIVIFSYYSCSSPISSFQHVPFVQYVV